MARGGDGGLRLLVLGGLGFVGWQWAQAQPANSSARKTLDQVRAAIDKATASLSGSPAVAARPIIATAGPVTDPGFAARAAASEAASGQPSAASEAAVGAGQPLVATSLVDLGGFPLMLDRDLGALVQDPSQGGTNAYGPGDVVLNSVDGAQYAIVAGDGVVLQGLDGGNPAVDTFFT